MQSTYKTLGKYIRKVEGRDTNKQVSLLLGVSIQKKFIPSIANTIGTDMSTYRIVKKNQFAYGPVTSRNGDKISIALLEDYDEAIVSQAYTVFEVADKEELLPEYLMMWFRRPEFDRYARYMSHGSAREIFDWEEMKNTTLPIPHIDKQREIVKEYHTIVNRIALNNQLIQKLEETAQAIYKQWFVDFEFQDAEGKPYKSNGGEMEFNEELGKDIPKGWHCDFIKGFGKVITGKTPSSENPAFFGGSMPFVTPTDFKNYNKFVLGADRNLSNAGINNLKNKVLKPDSIIVTCIGSDMGKVILSKSECITNQQINSIIPEKHFFSDYLYYYLQSISSELKSQALGGSTMPMINKADFEIIRVLKPIDSILLKFQNLVDPMNSCIWNCVRISKAALVMKDLLLSKLATIEDMSPVEEFETIEN